jgi:SAM-dependent methyltransferase
MNEYVHGYSNRESQRLSEQSDILEELLHGEVHFPAQSKVLEAGCGVGAQTLILSRRNPDIELTSIDISPQSLELARQSANSANVGNVQFVQADIHNLQFPQDHFDHVFVCFVLEHLNDPVIALNKLKKVLKKGGTLTVIEGDHGSCVWSPQTDAARAMWEAMIKVQQHIGHDPLIGRRLYSLLVDAGFGEVEVVPKPAYVDSSNPLARHDALAKILVPMATTAREKALELGLLSEEVWDMGLAEFSAVGDADDGSLFYTWFKGVGKKEG